MYTEGFEGLEEAEKESRRTYGSSSEVDRLIRENNKLKESLEKEKFFNKLLDQEIQELKLALPNGARPASPSEYWSGGRKVSRGAFYTLLFVTLLMAAYIGYGIYYDKRFSYLRNINAGTTPVAPTVVDNSNEQNATLIPRPADNNTGTKPESVPPAAAATATVRDSVPTIIGNKAAAAAPVAEKKKTPVVAAPDEEYDEEEVNAAINEPTRPARNQPARPSATTATPVQNRTTTSASTTTPPAATENRPVLAKYKITSKANFYNGPDENSMRGTFISASGDKTVSALEDKNGFIYVEYTNDLGFTSKGWLSKQDLTKE